MFNSHSFLNIRVSAAWHLVGSLRSSWKGRSANLIEQWKKDPWLFLGYIMDDILPSYVEIIENKPLFWDPHH